MQLISWPYSIPVESWSVFGKIFDGSNIFLGQIGLFCTDRGPPSSLSCSANSLELAVCCFVLFNQHLGVTGPLLQQSVPPRVKRKWIANVPPRCPLESLGRRSPPIALTTPMPSSIPSKKPTTNIIDNQGQALAAPCGRVQSSFGLIGEDTEWWW